MLPGAAWSSDTAPPAASGGVAVSDGPAAPLPVAADRKGVGVRSCLGLGLGLGSGLRLGLGLALGLG